MDKEDLEAVHRIVGAIHAFKMVGNFVDAGRYSLYKQAKDSGAYKIIGLDWKEFCRKKLGRDHESVNAEIKLLEEYGEPFLKAAEQLKLTRRELNAFGASLSEDARAEVKKGVVKIGNTEFKVEELVDNIAEFKSAVELLVRHKEVEQKEKKHLEKKLEGLEKEHKKEINAYEKELTDLKARVADPKLPEGFDEFFRAVERNTDEIVTLAHRLRFDDAHKDLEDEGRIKALYQARLQVIANQFSHCINKLENALGVVLSGGL